MSMMVLIADWGALQRGTMAGAERTTATQVAARPVEELERRIGQLERILDAVVVLNSTLDQEIQLDAIQKLATELTGTEVSSIFLLDGSTDELYAEVATGSAAERLKRVVVPLEGSIAGWVFRTGQVAVVNNVQHDERHYSQVDSLISEQAAPFVTRSILAVPLVVQGKTIGVLEVVNKLGDVPFSEDDQSVLAMLASQAAVAIEKARLFEQSDLISDVVHELRTPMTSIIGYSKMLNMPGIPSESRSQFANTIYREATRLGKMVNDFLEWARLEAGRIRFERKAVDVRRLVHETALLIEPQAQERGITIKRDLPEGALNVIGDAARLKQVLVNLASNGVKYNRDQGELSFGVRRTDGRACISVSDTGIGIPPESLDKIFDRFYRAPGAENVVRGSGLGLNVAKALVEAHGGSIDVESVVGKGTTFRIFLPLSSDL
jgi:signal transduction histidine kinase